MNRMEAEEKVDTWEVVAMTFPRPTVRKVAGNGVFVVGRDSFSNIQVYDATVSRAHACLTFGGSSVHVEDLESANGTRIVTVHTVGEATSVSDVAVQPRQPREIPDNAVLHLGSVVVLVRRVVSPCEARVDDFVADSPVMRETVQLLERLASSHLHVALVGPPGSGRDTLARILHERSERARGPFVASKMFSRAEAAMGCELFGVERGWGAPSPGLLEKAHGGTLMLDAADALSSAQQRELLRSLHGRCVTRVGGRRSIATDVRVVLGTTHETPLTKALCQLGGVLLAVPSLNERPADLETLAHVFVKRAARALGREPPPLSFEAKCILSEYDYPHNLRELAEIMTRALPLARSGPILPEHLLIMSDAGSSSLAGENDVTSVLDSPAQPS